MINHVRCRTIVLSFVLLLLAGSAGAVVHVDLGSPDENSWTVTYTFADGREGSQTMEILPYDFDMEIISAEPEKGGNPLRFEPINENKEGKPKFMVDYPQPVARDDRFRFRVVARMTDANSYFEDTAKLTFLYQTAHEVNVSLPAGYFPTFTDEPMELKREKDRVVLTSEGGKRRPVVIFAVKCGAGSTD
jgi:hypothetical protein